MYILKKIEKCLIATKKAKDKKVAKAYFQEELKKLDIDELIAYTNGLQKKSCKQYHKYRYSLGASMEEIMAGHKQIFSRTICKSL